MTGQPRRHSLLEQIANQALGFAVSYPINLFLLPALGMRGGAGMAFWVTLLFTAISIARGYVTRRLFNWWHLCHVRRGAKT